LTFSGEILKITAREDGVLGDAFPRVDRESEYKKMDGWLVVNPDRRVKRFSRFAYEWLRRCPAPKPRQEVAEWM
jgi:hypothetical protein